MNNEFGELEDDAPVKQPRKGGRTRDPNFLPWNEARDYIRSQMIPSRGKFEEWWNANKPKTIPRFPYRVYNKEGEWVSWNDFLGNDNKFNEKIGTKWRSMLEAMAYVHTLKLQTQEEWMTFCREPGKLPTDIPARPDLVYNEWRSWFHWLGNRPVEAVQAKRELEKIQVYYIIHNLQDPGNVMMFGIEPMGLKALKERWEKERFDIIKLFWFDPGKSGDIKAVVESLSSPYQGYERQRIVPNVWEMIFRLEFIMSSVTKDQMVRT